jgi:endonuclease III
MAWVRFGCDSRQVHWSMSKKRSLLLNRQVHFNLEVNMDSKTAIKQLGAIEKICGQGIRLAAEGWNEKWKILISTILSAQTRDEVTIEVCERLFKKYPTARKLGNAPIGDIGRMVRPINFYKTKSRNIKETAKIISEKGIPQTIEELIELPGVGRKVGNVYLAEAHGAAAIGVDTHVGRLSYKLGWTKNKDKHKIERDLEQLFPKRYWRSINYILVNFGRQHWTRIRDEDKLLKEVKKIK